jgi:hypothetical protein
MNKAVSYQQSATSLKEKIEGNAFGWFALTAVR